MNNLSDLAKYSITRSTRDLSAAAELLIYSVPRYRLYKFATCQLLIARKI